MEDFYILLSSTLGILGPIFVLCLFGTVMSFDVIPWVIKSLFCIGMPFIMIGCGLLAMYFTDLSIKARG